MLRIGVGSASLPYQAGLPLGGYAAREKPGCGLHDPLEARAITLRAATRHLTLVIADLIGVDEELAGAVRQALPTPGGEEGAVWVLATHTHSAPDPEQLSPEDRTALTDAMAAAGRAALAGRLPVELRVGHGTVTGVGSVRDAPGGEASFPIDVLEFRDGEAPVALLVNLACHPTVLGAGNLEGTADLPGAVRRALAGRLAADGVNPWIGVATGFAGDVSTRRLRREQTFGELARLGGLVAATAIDLIGEAELIPVRELRWEFERVTLERRTVRPAAELDALERELADARVAAAGANDAARARTLETALQGVDIERRLGDDNPESGLSVELGAAALGEVRLLCAPAELYQRSDYALRERIGRVVPMGYANGQIGYLPPRDHYDTADYEVLSSRAAAGSAERVVDALASLAAGLTHPPLSNATQE